MGSSILGIGISGLNAAQVGVATTGHNIANASTPGYTRQVVDQNAVGGSKTGVGFVGQGTEVSTVARVYNQFLNSQVITAQTSDSQLSTYSTQIQQIDNLLADKNAGVSPALQSFFTGIQNLSADPNSAAARQALLSTGNALSARFQGLASQLQEQAQGVNSQLTSSVTAVNGYATQIASLNDAIEKAQAGTTQTANDLLDQRDQAISELSKLVKVSVVQQGDSSNVFIGNGQPLVVGTKTTTLLTTTSQTDPSRLEISAKTASGTTVPLSEDSLPGGSIGGLFQFRSETLDVAQNTLGRLAITLGATFNAQHELGQTQTGAIGGAFFNVGVPDVTPNGANTGTGKTTAAITDPNALTVSDYNLKNIGSTATPIYKLTRLSDGVVTTFGPGATPPASLASSITVDGVSINVAGAPAAGDEFEIRPVRNGAAGFGVAITDKADIAVGVPVTSAVTSTNTGTGTISAPTVSATTLIPNGLSLGYSGTTLTGIPANLGVTVTGLATPPATPVVRTYAPGAAVTYNSGETISFGGVKAVFNTATTPPPSTLPVGAPNSTLVYTASSNSLSGFPAGVAVTVTANNVSTVFAPGAAVTYTPGATISFGGINLAVSGKPADGDSFKVAGNPTGQGDNRNALLLGALQTANTLEGGTTSFQGAYSQMVSDVGNKASELEATSAAASSLLEQSVASQQSESGVNLDEEAANLLRYQQAYQAAGKLIQTASTLFTTLLSLGSA